MTTKQKCATQNLLKKTCQFNQGQVRQLDNLHYVFLGISIQGHIDGDIMSPGRPQGHT